MQRNLTLRYHKPNRPCFTPGVVGLDNFNDYYPVSIKRARQANAETAGVYTVDGDLNDAALLRKLFDECQFTHILHLAAQVSNPARCPILGCCDLSTSSVYRQECGMQRSTRTAMCTPTSEDRSPCSRFVLMLFDDPSLPYYAPIRIGDQGTPAAPSSGVCKQQQRVRPQHKAAFWGGRPRGRACQPVCGHQAGA